MIVFDRMSLYLTDSMGNMSKIGNMSKLGNMTSMKIDTRSLAHVFITWARNHISSDCPGNELKWS